MASISTMSFGGMENWGLITYQPNRLLFDETMSDSEDRVDLAVTVSHEILHNVSTLTVLRTNCYVHVISILRRLTMRQTVNIVGKCSR